MWIRNRIVQNFLLAFSLFLVFSQAGFAGPAERFRGWYLILSGKDELNVERMTKNYVDVDTGTLQSIWDKYGNGPLPENLVPFKDRDTVLTGFTNRDFLIVTFESNTLMNDRYLRVPGKDDELFELYHMDNGQYRLGTRKAGVVNLYTLAPPVQNPTGFATEPPKPIKISAEIVQSALESALVNLHN